MFDLPRAGRSHAAHVAGELAPDGMVPRLPPPPGALRPAARSGLQHGLQDTAQPARGGHPAGRGIPDSTTHELLDVSSMNDNERGAGFWRTLDELADDPSFLERVRNEFPSEIEAIVDPVARRTFLKLMGASLALAGVTACTTQPAELIVPYARQPEELIPGRPLFFATAMPLGGSAQPLLVESHEGRPTKIEGNPQHQASLGATDVLAQSSILDLYDPDRSKTLTEVGDIRPWSSFLG